MRFPPAPPPAEIVAKAAALHGWLCPSQQGQAERRRAAPYREPPPPPTPQELAARVDALEDATTTTAAALEGALQTLAVMHADSETVRRYRKALGRIARGCASAVEAEAIARAALEGR